MPANGINVLIRILSPSIPDAIKTLVLRSLNRRRQEMLSPQPEAVTHSFWCVSPLKQLSHGPATSCICLPHKSTTHPKTRACFTSFCSFLFVIAYYDDWHTATTPQNGWLNVYSMLLNLTHDHCQTYLASIAELFEVDNALLERMVPCQRADTCNKCIDWVVRWQHSYFLFPLENLLVGGGLAQLYLPWGRPRANRLLVPHR